MLRNWKLLGLAATLAVAAPSPIVLAGGGEKTTDIKTVMSKIEEVAKTLKDQIEAMDKGVRASFDNMAKSVNDLKDEITFIKGEHLKIDSKVDKLEKALARLRMDFDELKDRSSLSAVDRAGLEYLKQRLTGIEDTLAKMQVQTRTSLSPATSTTGRITLVNYYNDKLLFEINGRLYTVPPEQSATIELPSGSFMYRVFSPLHGWIGDPQTRPLAVNENFVVTARRP